MASLYFHVYKCERLKVGGWLFFFYNKMYTNDTQPLTQICMQTDKNFEPIFWLLLSCISIRKVLWTSLIMYEIEFLEVWKKIVCPCNQNNDCDYCLSLSLPFFARFCLLLIYILIDFDCNESKLMIHCLWNVLRLAWTKTFFLNTRLTAKKSV